VILRKIIAVAGGAALLTLGAQAPASAFEIDLVNPICGTVPGPGLHLSLGVSPSAGGFGATATATLCGAAGIKTAVAMQFTGSGINRAPLSGGPIVGAPFQVATGNTASVHGSVEVASNLDQTVLVNVDATSVSLGGEFAANCQAVVDLVQGIPVILKGC
jgi:hypothetical protein